jgi:ABC-2 type transport system ATP-binding protein
VNLAIHTQALSRRFGNRLAVDQVSLHVPRGSIYGFLGRNGAGKTTTLKMLLGLLHPHGGRAIVAGVDVGLERIRAAHQVGALLEAQGFYVQLTGRENLDLCRRLRGCARSEVARVLELTEMTAHANRRVADYSLGMRQRLGLARAMLGEPPVLLLDEPTNGLDPEGIADMRGFLRQLPERTGATVLLSSHLLGEIEQVATHVGILSQGRLVLEGALDVLKAGLGSELTVRTDDPARAGHVARAHGFIVEQHADGLRTRLPADAGFPQATAALNRALCDAGVSVYAIAPHAPSLEHLYRHATATTVQHATAR